MKRMPISLMFLMMGYIGILVFATVFCHLRQGNHIKVDEKALHRISLCP